MSAINKKFFSEKQFTKNNVYCFSTIYIVFNYLNLMFCGLGLVIFWKDQVSCIVGLFMIGIGFFAHCFVVLSLIDLRYCYQQLGEW